MPASTPPIPVEILATLRTVLASVREYDAELTSLCAAIESQDPGSVEAQPSGKDYIILLDLLRPLFELIGDAAPGAPAAPGTTGEGA